MDHDEYALGLLKIPVSSVRTAAEFYEAALGFRRAFIVEAYGWAQLQAGSLQIALYQPGMGGGDATIGGSRDFHLEVRDLTALAARLKQHNALVGDAIQQADDGGSFAEVKDPDGNTFKVMAQADT
ncbi:MAG: VOC family protein [Phycisphaeraceae bacterium]